MRYWVLGSEVSQMVQLLVIASASLPKEGSSWDVGKDVQKLRNQGYNCIDVEVNRKANTSNRRGGNSKASVRAINKLRSY